MIAAAPRRPSVRTTWPLMLALLVALAGVLQASRPPAALLATAPADVFSAGRAMEDVRVLAQRPHPVGSAEHDAVAARLVARMTMLGLAPRVRGGRAVHVSGDTVTGAEVRNIVSILPGRERRLPAVLLMAHYDSVPSSPGAADDGAGLAAGLEVIRALRSGGGGRRDVILLFTDAEEKGLLGARAFFADDPLAARIGFVVNMDMRGGGGRAIMHETGRDAAGAIAMYRRTAIHPTTDSIAAWVERLIRNSSDFRVAVDRGLPGLNYAILDRQFDYHAASSTPDRLDPRSLQHLGEQVLAVTRALRGADALPTRGADPAYASLLGGAVIVYPAWAGWLILGGAAALAGIAWRRGGVKSRDAPRAFFAALHLLLTLILSLTLIRAATAVPTGFAAGRPLLAWWTTYEAALALASIGIVLAWFTGAVQRRQGVATIVPLVLGAVLVATGAGGWVLSLTAAVAALAGWFGAGARRADGATGIGLLMFALSLALVVQTIAPVAGPSLLIAVAGASILLPVSTTRVRGVRWLVAVGAGLLVAQLMSTAHLLLLAVGETIPAVAAPFAFLCALALAPLLLRLASARALGTAGAAAVMLAAILTGLIRWGNPVSAAMPGLSQIVHLTDGASGRGWRVSGLAAPDGWTRTVLGRGERRSLSPLFDQAWAARDGHGAATARVRLDHVPGGLLALDVRGPPGTREIRVTLEATAPVATARANGVAVPLLTHAGRRETLRWAGRDVALRLRLRPAAAAGRLAVRVVTLRDGWPVAASPLPPRGPDTMPWYDSDVSATINTASIVW